MKSALRIMVIFASTLLFGASAMAAASDYGAVFGFRSQSGDLDPATTTTNTSKAAIGYQLGITTSFQMSGPLNLRTGLMYVERPLKVSSIASGDEADYKLTYFDVPVLLSYKFEDYAAVYAGVSLSVNLSSSASGKGSLSAAKVTDAKSMIVPITLGAAFRFAPQIGADVFFETVPGELALGLKSYRAVGVNLLYFFD
ncbi:MAG: outer membrane beta-barrel protein [Bdellovibrionaceae bacterium]|nr:outer membrane beta-barrel protein [Pseudobdellovibrionaceae bacterium]